MMSPASGAVAVTKALNAIGRDDRGRLLSALIARIRNFQLAEDCLQEAMISALIHWGRNGLPSSPHGWLLQVAYRKAIDRLRRRKSEAALGAQVQILAPDEAHDEETDVIPDERLRLIFTCCHPALASKSQVALTLRTLGGLSTTEIARAFLDNETTMGQRLSRAKAKIAAAGIPFAVPEPDQWDERLQSVLSVIYLIFNAGYTAGPGAGRDLVEEAIYLARLLDQLRPEEAEVEACVALLLITHARRGARVGEDGASVALASQDRALWAHAEIAEGIALLDRAVARGAPGPYQIKAAIAACHVEEHGSDWRQIAALYDSLLRFEPTAIVRLNRAVAHAEAGAEALGMQLLETLGSELQAYQPFHAARADVLAKNGRPADALMAYDKAIALSISASDIAFLKGRRDRLRA